MCLVMLRITRLALVVSVATAGSVALAQPAPAHPTPQKLLAFGRSMLNAGHPQAALAFLEEAVTISPSLADGYELLGDAWTTVGRFDKAVVAYEKFLALAPADPRAKLITRAVADLKPRRRHTSG
jgi:Flp pilus assembly protein TadD